MSEDAPNSNTHPPDKFAYLHALETSFPDISRMPIDTSFLDEPVLKKLVNLIQFSIPIHTYQPEILALYDRISEIYYDYCFRNSLPPKKTAVESHVSLQPVQSVEIKLA
jgi:hypothetical protein